LTLPLIQAGYLSIIRPKKMGAIGSHSSCDIKFQQQKLHLQSADYQRVITFRQSIS